MIGALLRDLLRLRSLVILFGLICLSLVVWFFGAKLSVAGYTPLASSGARITLIVSLFVVFLLGIIVRYILVRRANAKLINNLIAADDLSRMADNQAEEEIEQIRQRYEAALTYLKTNAFSGRGGGRMLFELPWYVLIGAPGTGKTTILRNSGLEFPMSEQIGADVLQGIGGTRNCDWWFTEDAVLIDTAGRYVTQDVNAQIDRAAWLGFLDILKSHRTRRPINGVLLIVSIGEILSKTETERKIVADTLRRRLQEIVKVFEVQVPVYLLLTKCDLIVGFNEFFEDLPESDRQQVWGITLPADRQVSQLATEVDNRLRETFETVEAMALPRLHAERDPERRARIFLFPRELASVRSMLSTFVNDVFRTSRYEKPVLFRGLYLTSGTQECTQDERLLGAFSRTFGLAPGQVVPYVGRAKAFFIRRLLTDVVFAERDLVGFNSKLEHRLAARYGLGYFAAVGLVVVLGSLWIGLLARSEAEIKEVSNAAAAFEAQLRSLPAQTDLVGALPVLNAAKRLRDNASQSDDFSLLSSFGITPSLALEPIAQKLYDRTLTSVLLPAVSNRLMLQVAALSRSTSTNDLQALRSYLGAYEMLDDPQQYKASYLQDVVNADLSRAFPLDPDRQKQMQGHVAALTNVLPQPVTLNQGVISEARQRLTQVPPNDEVFDTLLRQAAARSDLPPLNMQSIIGSTALTLDPSRSGGRDAMLQIPGIYTKKGFYDFFLPSLPTIVRQSLGSDWIEGQTSPQDAGYQELVRKVSDQYVQAYIATWQTMLSQVAVVDFGDLQRANMVLSALAGPDSPLSKLASVVKDNTVLPPPGSQTASGESGAGGAAAATGAAGGVAALAQSANNAAITAALGGIPWPGDQIETAFKPVIAFVAGDGTNQAELPKVQQLIGTIYGDLNGIAGAPDPAAAGFDYAAKRAKAPTQDALATLKTEAVLRPAPFKGIMEDVSTRSWAVMMNLAYSHINAQWQTTVIPVCTDALTGRFPLTASQQEVTLQDFTDAFRSGGLFDQFSKTYLDPFVVRNGGQITAARIDGQSLPFGETTLARMRQADQVRTAFFTDGTKLGVKFSLTTSYLDPKALRSTFSLDGTDVVYRHEPPRSVDMTWPNKADASMASVAVQLLDGSGFKAEKTGPWALFRLLYGAGIAPSGSGDQFTFSVTNKDGVRVSYGLQASSVVNPFNRGIISGFDCPGNI